MQNLVQNTVYGYLYRGYIGDSVEEESMVYAPLQGKMEIARLFALGCDRIEIATLLVRPGIQVFHSPEEAYEWSP